MEINSAKTKEVIIQTNPRATSDIFLVIINNQLGEEVGHLEYLGARLIRQTSNNSSGKQPANTLISKLRSFAVRQYTLELTYRSLIPSPGEPSSNHGGEVCVHLGAVFGPR